VNKIKKLFLNLLVFLVIFSNSSVLRAAPESFADLVEVLVPSVVSIASTTIVQSQNNPTIPRFPEGSPFDEFFKDYFENENRNFPSERPMVGLGSGFIVDKLGIIVTNNHVIEGANEITVIMHDQKEFTAKLLGRDPKADIAVLKIDPKGIELKEVKWGNSDSIRVGDWSIAIGNPLGLGGTVTVGIISAISRDIGNGPYVKFLQTDASINRGNSGGPLFNINGEVVGINSAIISQSGGSIGLGFAIPSNSAYKIVNQLKEFGRTKRGWLGVQITPVSKDISESLGLPDEKGAFISSLNPDGPSLAAGIQEGDVILEFNEIKILKMTDLPRLVAESDIGSSAILKIWRKNKYINIELILGELPEESFVERKDVNENKEDKISFIKIKSLNLIIKNTLNNNGVVVEETNNNPKLLKGDIIKEVNREIVSDSQNFTLLVKGFEESGRSSLLLKVLRKEKSLWITIKFDK